jgi:transposase
MVKSISNLSSVTVVGLDTAKNVFHVHCVDEGGFVVLARALRRAQALTFFASLPSCLVGLEACSSAFHWEIPGGHRHRLECLTFGVHSSILSP